MHLPLNKDKCIDQQYPQESQFHQLAESEGFIMAHPLAELLPGNEGEWILNTAANSRDDLDFVEALIDDISARYPVNPQRIYATGYSLGSMFVYELTCHLGDRFAAVASHAGTMPVEPALCAPEGKAAILHIHGADDFLIAYDNTWDWKAWDSVGTMRDVPSLILFWQELYGCQDLNTDDQGATRHVVYDGCEQDLRVEHYRLGGVGHEWPNAINGRSTHEVVWGFVSTFNKQ